MATLEPPPASQRFRGTRSGTRRAAQEYQRAIHEKLAKADMPIPHYEILDLIGKGSYGKVYLAKDLDHNRLAAIKVIDADAVDYSDAPHNMREQTMQDFQHEVKVLSALKEYKVPNVNTIYDVFVVHDQLWIVTEFCAGGSVHTLMHAQADNLQEKYIIPIIREVVKGLAKIHEAGIIHRDIKAANIMITETGSVQIIDFGVAATIEPWANKRGTFIGTPNWMAPEFYKMSPADLQYGQEVDIWAVGCTVYEMATGRPPNSKRSQNRRLIGHELSRNPPRLTPNENVSQALCAFVEFLLQADPKNRPKASEVLDHPFIKGTEKTHASTMLVDLVIDFNRWENEGGARYSLYIPDSLEPMPQTGNDNVHDLSKDTDWRFSMVSTGSSDWMEQFATSEEANDFTGAAQGMHMQRAPSIQIESAIDDLSYAESELLLVPVKHRMLVPNPVLASFLTIVVLPLATTRSPLANSSLRERTEHDKYSEATTLSPEATYKPSSDGPNERSELRGTSPGPKAMVDQRAAQRGGNQLASIFNETKRPYQYGKDSSDDSSTPASANRSQSDLPLRNIASSSDVRQKEIFAPDPSQPRPLATSIIPNIGSVNIGTIKQNRMLNRAGGGGLQSDSSGDEQSDHFGNQQERQKRATMAWEPEWNVPAASEEPAQLNTSSLAPPTALQRPTLQQANTAPGEIPIAPHLAHGSRASTASVLDMDALMGEDMPSSLESSFHFSQSNDAFQHPVFTSDESSQAFDNMPAIHVDHSEAEEDENEVLSLEPATPGSSSPTQDDRYAFKSDENGYVRDLPTSITASRFADGLPSITSAFPSEQAMTDGASNDVLQHELTHLVEALSGELGAVQGLIDERLENVEMEYRRLMEDSYEEEDDEERES